MPRARPGPKLKAPDRKKVSWRKAWRIIASRYPPIDLFERVSDKPEVWDALIKLEELTNPRYREEVGDISLVPPARRVAGAGASYVMASFTHVNPKGSRFSDGSYGVYYCGESFETALSETIFHFEQFARDSSDPTRSEDMRVLLGSLSHEFHDVSTVSKQRLAAIMDPNSYAISQPFGHELRENGSDGVFYPSVRRAGGECVGAFWPDAVGLPHQERHIRYHWDGARVDKYFDYSKDAWIELEGAGS